MVPIKSSASELKMLIDFFGLDSSVMDWRYHPEKNFLCLYKPVKFCLHKRKGTTRDTSIDDYDEELVKRYPELKIWRLAFRDQMIKMYQHIFQCTAEIECCRIQFDENSRWKWLRKYYCEN